MEKIKQGALRVEQLSLRVLKLDTRNPRLHSDRQIKQIARSIANFGFLVPALIDHEGKVLAGHGRLQAAKKLGLTEIPVIRLEHLTPEQARAFSIADNRLAETSTWDDRMLGEILSELSLVDLDIEATGFTVAEIDLRIEGLSRVPAEKSDPDDQLPEPALSPVSRPGSLLAARRAQSVLWQRA